VCAAREISVPIFELHPKIGIEISREAPATLRESKVIFSCVWRGRRDFDVEFLDMRGMPTRHQVVKLLANNQLAMI
jgi:hypothetical protein